MMSKLTKASPIWALVIISHLLLAPPAQAGINDQPKKILVVYDQRTFYSFINDEVTSIVHLLYHFPVSVDEVSVRSYEQGMYKPYDYLIYIGIENNDLSTYPNLLADLAESDMPLLFIGRGIEYLLGQNRAYGISHQKTFQPTRVTYREQEFALHTSHPAEKIEVESPAVKVLSSLSDGSDWHPYILTSENLWYVSHLNTDEKPLFFILADILHDFFAVEHHPQPQVYVRIEGVHCLRPPESLYEIADFLASQDIPFMVALIPAYYDSENDHTHYLHNQKEFAQAIRYMQDAGGSILLHGYTHQIHKDMPGEGFEFWDGEKDCPLDVDIAQRVHERINAGIDDCVAAGIHPLAFEPPHYAVSQDAYPHLKAYFSTIIGHLQTSDEGFTTTVYPFRLHNSPLYNQLLPENLGYVDPDNPLSTEQILEKFTWVSLVRDFTAGFYFHPFCDIAHLKEIIAALKQHDVRFLDLKQEDNWVKGDKHTIRSTGGTITVSSLKAKESPLLFLHLIKGAMTLLVFVSALLCLRLLVIFIRARRQGRENLFR